jgi:formylglycine-generating enzyme required for sulfatase activity
MKASRWIPLIAFLICVALFSGCGGGKGGKGGNGGLKKNQVAAPISSPPSGKVLVGMEISLTTSTAGATIYYTVDGTEPTTESTVYSDTQKPVVPEGGMTLKAFAIKDGMLPSNIATFVYSTYDELPVEQVTHQVGGVGFRMRRAPAGLTFPFGMYSETATIDYAFLIGETEVTYELWLVVYNWATDEARGAGRYYFQRTGQAGNSGVYFEGEQDPVTSISWRDALVWCNALTEYYNAKNGTDWKCVYIDGEGKPIRDSRDTNADVCDQAAALPTADGFRLPVSKEWELAARYIDGSDWLPWNHASGDLSGTSYPPENVTTTHIGDYVWYAENSGEQTHPVATKKSNPFGLFDMSGNVSEVCFDRHWNDATRRVIRGGGIWSQLGEYSLLVSFEDWIEPDVASGTYGFRLARTD